MNNLLQEAKIKLLEMMESLDKIEILAYSYCKDDISTEFLIMDTSTIPEGLSGDFVPKFFLLVNKDTQWKLINNLDDDELTDWVLENDKEIIVVSSQFCYLQSVLEEVNT